MAALVPMVLMGCPQRMVNALTPDSTYVRHRGLAGYNFQWAWASGYAAGQAV